MSMHHLHLEDKLQELQGKCYQMEDLMKELKEMRREQKSHLQLHNELDSGSITSSQAHMMDGIIVWTTDGHTAKDVCEVLQLLETRKELKKRSSAMLPEWKRVYTWRWGAAIILSSLWQLCHKLYTTLTCIVVSIPHHVGDWRFDFLMGNQMLNSLVKL